LIGNKQMNKEIVDIMLDNLTEEQEKTFYILLTLGFREDLQKKIRELREEYDKDENKQTEFEYKLKIVYDFYRRNK
jgi:hypothetical protein